MNRYKATQKDIESFLENLKSLLNSPTFNSERDFLLGRKYERTKNRETLLALNMNRDDVIEELKKLTVSEYYQSVPDDKNNEMPDFHVFFVSICAKEIYIKIRIQNIKNVLCISFHFSEYSHGEMPY